MSDWRERARQRVGDRVRARMEEILADESTDVEIPEWVTEGIDAVFRPKKGIPGRYPYTYAYDFLRSHAEEFGLDKVGLNQFTASRADVSNWVRKRVGYYVGDADVIHRAVCEALADAYLREHNEVLPVE